MAKWGEIEVKCAEDREEAFRANLDELCKPVPPITTKIIRECEVSGTLEGLMDLCRHGKIPEHAGVQVHIPGGGDYSRMSLSPEDLTFTARWVEEDTE